MSAVCLENLFHNSVIFDFLVLYSYTISRASCYMPISKITSLILFIMILNSGGSGGGQSLGQGWINPAAIISVVGYCRGLFPFSTYITNEISKITAGVRSRQDQTCGQVHSEPLLSPICFTWSLYLFRTYKYITNLNSKITRTSMPVVGSRTKNKIQD
jgi:hypothetical protein